jgi:uncharacterized membrane-anchored protein
MAVAVPSVITGTARVGLRTKELVRRLGPGELAGIDHRNLDRVAAQELVAASPAAVVSASPSADGTYPNLGPLTLLRAGIPLIDADAGLLDRVADAIPSRSVPTRSGSPRSRPPTRGCSMPRSS